MKRSSGFFKGILDGLRSSVSQRSEFSYDGNLQPDLFQVRKTVRHGFPFQPTAIAFDSVQHILAIGTKSGCLRLFGCPGVDTCVQHEIESAILQILFLINEGALITICANDSIHFWNISLKQPGIIHSLRFQKERVTFASLTFNSKWLYVGTEKGNVHIVNVESFILSAYVINWNKAIDTSKKSHPGPVVYLCENPADSNKLLIGYESGAVVLWDFRNKVADCRFYCSEILKSCTWHHEGKQFMCSYNTGCIRTWSVKNPTKPDSIIYPHDKSLKEGNPDLCQTITKVEWKSARGSDSFIIFSGLASDRNNQNPCVTVIHGKTTTVLEMEHKIIDFITLCETPWPSDFQEPYAIIVLLVNDLVVIDLTCSGYPCYQNPYPMDLHESPVTSCSYFVDCPDDLIPALRLEGCKVKKKHNFSEKVDIFQDWPVDGGELGVPAESTSEIIITGHADGSLKFWDASSVYLQILHKLKISRFFEKPTTDNHEVDPFAIERVAFCPVSKILCVANVSSHVIIFKFAKDNPIDTVILEIPVFYETFDDTDNTENDTSLFKQSKTDAMGSVQMDSTVTCSYVPLKVKSGGTKKNTGFQADIICVMTVINRETPLLITSLAVNSTIGLMAFGSDCGLAIIDLIQKCCVANLNTPDLYGSSDPYQRVPRSPKKNCSILDNVSNQDKCRSPTNDQVNGMCLSPTTKKHLLQRKHTSAEMRRAKSQDKITCSFSQSRSSSMSSIENMYYEAVQCLVFANSYCRKSDFVATPTLWIGTNIGSVLVIHLQISESLSLRDTQPVIISISGTLYRLKGAILSISFFDSTGTSFLKQFEEWSLDDNACLEKGKKKLDSSGQIKGKSSPTSDLNHSQLVVVCSEKQVFIISVPSQTCVHKINLTDSCFVVQAEILLLQDDKIGLACYFSSGNISVLSLPSLKTVYSEDFLPLTDIRVARTFCFSTNGHGVYLCSPTELQKFSLLASYSEILPSTLGTFFVSKEIPEATKVSFFKGLFSSVPSTIDREELFGEASGKASKYVSYVNNSPSTEQVKSQSDTLGGELAKVKQNLAERGEALSQLEYRTEKMMSEAESFQSAARQLATKFKDKKWYQF